MTFFFFVAALRLRLWRGRPGATVFQGILGALVLLAGAAVLFEWAELRGSREGIIVAREVEVRAGPGATYTISFRLHEGTEVEVLRSASGWREVKVSDRLQGWAEEEAVAAL